jgi:hypothetical protein
VRGAQAGKPLADLSIPERYRWVPPAVQAGLPFNVAQLYMRMAEGIREKKSVSPDFDVAVMWLSTATIAGRDSEGVGHRDPPDSLATMVRLSVTVSEAPLFRRRVRQKMSDLEHCKAEVEARLN